MDYPLERRVTVERQQLAALDRQRRNLAAGEGDKSMCSAVDRSNTA
jgi:hypothetical protein